MYIHNYAIQLSNLRMKLPLTRNIISVWLSGFDKRYLQKFQVRFNNLTLEVNKKQLKVAS